MRRPFANAVSIVLVCCLAGACAEEQADDIPDLSGESRRGRGRLLEKLPEVRELPADATGSELIDGLTSMLRFDQTLEIVKESPHYVSGDAFLEERGECRGLRTRMLVVDPWNDLGFSGRLTLTFYNGILGQARFGTGNLEGYKKAARKERDVLIRTVKRHRVNEHVEVWIPPLPPFAAIYSDRRIMKWQDSIARACRYQTQIEAGDSPPRS